MKIVWLEQAAEDMDSIYEYYLTKSPYIAIRIYNNILKESEYLINFPNIGKVESFLDDLPQTTRSLVVSSGSYKILYYVINDKIYIYRVWDCRKNPNSLR